MRSVWSPLGPTNGTGARPNGASAIIAKPLYSRFAKRQITTSHGINRAIAEVVAQLLVLQLQGLCDAAQTKLFATSFVPFLNDL
jgi:hypothetical protein